MEAEQQEQQQHACSSFSLVHEASLPSPVVLASWCPTMDLVAVFTADNQLSVHRLSWQRLWTVPLDAHVSAMCWRPDGAGLATARAHRDLTPGLCITWLRCCVLAQARRSPLAQRPARSRSTTWRRARCWPRGRPPSPPQDRHPPPAQLQGRLRTPPQPAPALPPSWTCAGSKDRCPAPPPSSGRHVSSTASEPHPPAGAAPQ